MSGFFDKLKRANELLAKKGFPELIEKLLEQVKILKDGLLIEPKKSSG